MIWTELAIQRENGKGRKILGHVLYPSSAFISLTHINSLVAHCIPPLCLALISLHTQLSLFAPLHCSVYQNNYLSALLSAVASREEDDTLRKLEDREGRTPNLIIGILFFSFWNVGPFIDLIFEERNRLVNTYESWTNEYLTIDTIVALVSSAHSHCTIYTSLRRECTLLYKIALSQGNLSF